MNFSQRMGLAPIQDTIQVQTMDNDLTRELWNLIYQHFYCDLIKMEESKRNKLDFNSLFYSIHKNFFKKRVNTIPIMVPEFLLLTAFDTLHEIETWFFKKYRLWYEKYDILEFLVRSDNTYLKNNFKDKCNVILKNNLSAYRFVGENLTRIISESEMDSIEKTLKLEDLWQPVYTHLHNAIEKVSNRTNPDFRNSVKESISAIESCVKIIMNDDKATLGQLLNKLSSTHNLHHAFIEALSKLYGYTSDAGGIRHSLLGKSEDVKFEEAKFMLVTSSAFINYLKDRFDQIN